jgi:hypothetical protein
VNQWTGEYVDSFLSGGNPIQALECVGDLRTGKTSGLRIIYYFYLTEQIWLMTRYDKDEAADLTPKSCAIT